MSFILDALKKSESERRDRSGPELAYATGGAEREALPRWVVVLAILLLVNLLVVGGLFLAKPRQPAVSRQDAPVNTAAVPLAEPAARTNQAGQPPSEAAKSGTATTNGAPVGPSAGQASIAPAAGGPARSLQQEAASATTPPTTPDLARNSTNATARQPAQAESEPAALPGPSVTDTEPTPPSLSELQGRGMLMNLPALGVDLHVYAAQPEARFVFINLNRYREGERLREGPLVERITPDGVILQHEGQRFLLPRG